MTREIELSTSRAALVQILDRNASPRATWHLPASKTDPQAFGVSRTHGCPCASTPGPNCPAHALWDQLLFLRRQFPGRWSAAGPDWDLPLFPTLDGRVVEKGGYGSHDPPSSHHARLASVISRSDRTNHRAHAARHGGSRSLPSGPRPVGDSASGALGVGRGPPLCPPGLSGTIVHMGSAGIPLHRGIIVRILIPIFAAPVDGGPAQKVGRSGSR